MLEDSGTWDHSLEFKNFISFHIIKSNKLLQSAVGSFHTICYLLKIKLIEQDDRVYCLQKMVYLLLLIFISL
jgi:hypothetical protein